MDDKGAQADEPRWSLTADDPRAVDPPTRACPFCGSSDTFFFEYVYSKSFAVACRSCGAQGPRRRSPRAARELWDRRP